MNSYFGFPRFTNYPSHQPMWSDHRYPVKQPRSFYESPSAFYESPFGFEDDLYLDQFESPFIPSIYRKPRPSPVPKTNNRRQQSSVASSAKTNPRTKVNTTVPSEAATEDDNSMEADGPVKGDQQSLHDESDVSTEQQQQQHPIQSSLCKEKEEQNNEDGKVEAEDADSDEGKVNQKLEAIKKIENDVDAMKNSIDGFAGSKGSKEHLYISETLISYLLKLDEIQAEGNEQIRKSRKSVVVKVQSYLETLEESLTTEGENMESSSSLKTDSTDSTDSETMMMSDRVQEELQEKGVESLEGEKEEQMESSSQETDMTELTAANNDDHRLQEEMQENTEDTNFIN